VYVFLQVAEELTAKDVILAHARDELGIDLDELSSPLKAAVASGLAFLVGAGLPLLAGSFLHDYIKYSPHYHIDCP
jgi:VIT1/CCC1 family predicted Fe2+/Mn2+ transporter